MSSCSGGLTTTPALLLGLLLALALRAVHSSGNLSSSSSPSREQQHAAPIALVDDNMWSCAVSTLVGSLASRLVVRGPVLAADRGCHTSRCVHGRDRCWLAGGHSCGAAGLGTWQPHLCTHRRLTTGLAVPGLAPQPHPFHKHIHTCIKHIHASVKHV